MKGLVRGEGWGKRGKRNGNEVSTREARDGKREEKILSSQLKESVFLNAYILLLAPSTLLCSLVSLSLQVAVCKAVVAGSSLSLIKQDLVIGSGSVSG